MWAMLSRHSHSKSDSVMELDSESGVQALVKGKWMEAERLLKPLKDHNHLSSARYALVHVLRFILTSDRGLLPEALERVTLAESICSQARSIRKSAFEDFAGKSRSWKDTLMLSSKFPNPYCEATMENFTDVAIEHLEMWRLAHGLHAFLLLLKALLLLGSGSVGKLIQGAMALRSAWVQCRCVNLDGSPNNRKNIKSKTSDSKEIAASVLMTETISCPGGHANSSILDAGIAHSHDESGFAYLVKGIFLVLLENLPPHLRTVFSGIGFQFDRELGIRLLDKTMKNKKYIEVRMFGAVILSLVHLLLSQREYNKNMKEEMQLANSVVRNFCTSDPGLVLVEWVRSHVIRRQGCLKEAMAILDRITPTVQNEINLFNETENTKDVFMDKVGQDLDAVVNGGKKANRVVNSYRLEFDRAILHFVSFDFGDAINFLEPLTVVESTFNAKVLACMVLAGCYSMSAKLGAESRKEKYIYALRRMTAVVSDKKLHKIDKSILLKNESLLRRVNQDLVVYEVLYIFGHMKSYSPLTGKGSLPWLQQRYAHLDKITQSITGIDFSSLDIDTAGELSDERLAAVEELFTATLIKAAVLNLQDNCELAKPLLSNIIQNCNYVCKVLSDPYTVPWAYYEFGVALMRNGTETDTVATKNYFTEAKKFSKKHEYSFSHMLEYKCTGALRELKESEKTK